jgi:hypothetical protein
MNLADLIRKQQEAKAARMAGTEPASVATVRTEPAVATAPVKISLGGVKKPEQPQAATPANAKEPPNANPVAPTQNSPPTNGPRKISFGVKKTIAPPTTDKSSVGLIQQTVAGPINVGEAAKPIAIKTSGGVTTIQQPIPPGVISSVNINAASHAPDEKVPDAERAEFSKSLEVLRASFENPDLVANATSNLLLSLKRNPQFVGVLAPEDIGMMARALRTSRNIAQIARGTNKAKASRRKKDDLDLTEMLRAQIAESEGKPSLDVDADEDN